MERYLGIDVHRDSSTICVLSGAGKLLARDVVETKAATLIRSLKRHRGRLHVCIEESPWSEWLNEVLSPHTSELVVYQGVWRPGPKSDAIDAHALAEKLRLGQTGPGVFQAAKRYRHLRSWARTYRALVTDTVRAKNRLKSLLRRRAIECSGTKVYDPRQRDQWLDQLPVCVRASAHLLGRQLDQLTELRAEAEASLVEASHRLRISRILETAPGIGPIRAALLIATVVTPHRFRSKRQFWTYSGLAVVTRSSSDWVQTEHGWDRAQTTHTRGLNRNHNPTLKAIFKGAAMTAIHQSAAPTPLRQSYDRLLKHGTRPPLARLTIARKIAATVLAMWKRQEVYHGVN